MPDQKKSGQNKSGLSENSLGAIAYITVVPAIFFLAIPPYNKNAYVRFHAWQSVILSVLAFILCLVLSFFPVLNTYLESVVYLGLYMLVWLVWILISIWCAIASLNGKRIKLPLLGSWADMQSNK
ncbi:MAG: Tic20 family protein [Terracidiphilus sp.]|jgi:uncharacterized membrane protein